MNGVGIAVLGAVVLLGAALFWRVFVDRRRQGLQQRLKAVVTMTHSEDDPAPSLALRRRLSRSGPGGINSLLAALRERFDGHFAAAGNRIGWPHLIAVGSLAAVAVFGLANRVLGLNPVLAVVPGVAAALAASAGVLSLAQATYRNRFLDVFPDALDLICRAVKAGLPVGEAMAVAAHEIADPVGSELRRIHDEVQIGVEQHDALQKTADRIRVPDFRFYVVALALQKRTGGSLAETLGNLSAVIRARKALRLKTRALSAEAKVSAFILSLLPFLVGGFMYVVNPDLMSLLFTDHRGRFVVGVALVSLGMGIATMVMLIKRALR